MSDLTLYHCPGTRSTGTLWPLEEMGAEYTLETINVRAGRTAEFLKINPSGKVPAIRHKGQTLGELSAISLYLCDVFPEAGLAPALDDPKRAQHYFWHVYRPGVMEPAMISKGQGWKAEPGMIGWGELDDVVKRVDETLTQNDYLLGDSFSASDICAGGAVSWMVAFGMIEPTPAIKAYLERLQSRKAYRRMLEIDAELAPKA